MNDSSNVPAVERRASQPSSSSTAGLPIQREEISGFDSHELNLEDDIDVTELDLGTIKNKVFQEEIIVMREELQQMQEEAEQCEKMMKEDDEQDHAHSDTPEEVGGSQRRA